MTACSVPGPRSQPTSSQETVSSNILSPNFRQIYGSPCLSLLQCQERLRDSRTLFGSQQSTQGAFREPFTGKQKNEKLCILFATASESAEGLLPLYERDR